MSKRDNLSDYLTDLYQGIESKKPGASRNPQDFRGEIEQIETKSPEWDGSYETSPDTDIVEGGGSCEEAVLIPKTATENKTYYASDDGADGYSEFTVAVPIPETPEVTSEEMTVTPTKSVQEITPINAAFLSKVTVEAIPDEYEIVPEWGGDLFFARKFNDRLTVFNTEGSGAIATGWNGEVFFYVKTNLPGTGDVTIACTEIYQEIDGTLWYNVSGISPSVPGVSEYLPQYIKVYNSDTGWLTEDYGEGIQTIVTFVASPSSFRDDAATWFDENTDDHVPSTSGITYNGRVESVNAGSRVVLTCKGYKMASDVVLEIEAGGGSCEEPVLISKTATENKTYKASEDGADGYSEVLVEVPMPVIIDASDTPITENGTYEASDYGIDGISKIVVNVASSCDRSLKYWFFEGVDQYENMDWDEDGNEIYVYEGAKDSVTVPRQVQDGSVTSFEGLFLSLVESYVDNTTWGTGLFVKEINGVINCANVSDLSSLFINCLFTEKICPIINTENVTVFQSMFGGCERLVSTPTIDMRSAQNARYMFSGCNALESINLKNIKISIDISISNNLTVDSLVGLCYELINYSGSSSSKPTLTIGGTNLAKLADVYVKLVDITDEMREEDKFVSSKKPFDRCESTDEGAVLITDYVVSKNWKLQ